MTNAPIPLSPTLPKRVLVSGVSGQDGSYMVDYLLANTDHLVYGMVRRTAKPDYGNLAAALNSPRFQLVTGDLSDSHSIDKLVREIKPDYLINLGAQSFVKASWDLPEQTQQVNAEGVLHCLEAVRKHVPHCRFYNAGTSEEFGAVEYSPQDEKHPARPQSPYGASKVAARQHVRVYRESYGLYAIQGWLFNHESPRRGHEFVTRKITRGVARIARAIKDGKLFEPIELGNLDAKRDWSHAKDFVDGIWRMLNQKRHTHPGTPAVDIAPEFYDEWHKRRAEEDAKAEREWQPGEYVLASGETHTVREFVEKAFAAAGIDLAPYQHATCSEEEGYHWTGADPQPWVVKVNPAFYRPAEVALLHGDATRARAELGWAPKISFDQLVTEMVQADLREVGL